jgi:MinD-like ATPase involved in chromosome partitioning or flagellar assembly
VDPNRFKEAYAKLEVLDDRLSYKVRSRSIQNRSAEPEKLDERVRDVAEMVLELKDVVRELMLAIASKPGSKSAGE